MLPFLLTVATVVAPLGALPAAQATPIDPSMTAGVRLPVLPQAPGRGTDFRLASSDYLGFSRTQYDETAPSDKATVDVYRTSDATRVATVPVSSYGYLLDELSSSSLVHRDATPEGTTVVVSDVETGRVSWSVWVPKAELIISTGDTWVLSVASDETHAVILRRPGQPQQVVSGITLSAYQLPYIDGDSRGFVVSNNGGTVWTLDLDSASADVVLTTTRSLHVYATPSRFFAVEDGYNTIDDVVHWWERDGVGQGQVSVPAVPDGRNYVPFGDRLASVRAETGWSDRVEPVDLGSGAREDAVLTHVLSIHALGDGRLAAVIGDTGNGRVVLVGDGAPATTFRELPELGETAVSVGLSGDRVVTGYGDAWNTAYGTTWTTPLDGSSSPQQLTDGTDVIAGGLVQAAGDTVLTQATSTGCCGDGSYRVVWPGGHRDLPTAARLGRGGLVLARADAFEDARSGAPLGAVPSGPYVVDGRTLWTLSRDGALLTAHDLSGASPDRSVTTYLPTTCGDVLESGGRFLLVRCLDDYFSVDTLGIYRPWKLAYHAPQPSDPQVGAGFAAWTTYQEDAQGQTQAVVMVQDLGPSRQTRTYGLAHGRYNPPGPILAVDDNAPRLVYADSQSLIRRVDLDWLTAPAQTLVDTSAPHVVSTGGSARATAGPLSAQWAFSDSADESPFVPSGVQDYDLRYQQPAVLSPVVEGSWVTPDSLTHLTKTTAMLPSTPGRDTCWSVRARDRAGNASAWTAPRCTTVDVTAPVVRLTAPTALATTSTAALVAWTGSDSAGVASYDVRYRRATFGGSLGGYVAVANGTKVKSLGVNLAAGYQYCFSVRGRDGLGNVSAWTAERCIAKVLDDRSLTIGSSAWTRTGASVFYGGTVTTTRTAGVALTRPGVTARQVFVLATTCSSCGSVAVYVGSTKVGTLSLTSSSTRNKVMLSTTLSTARSGTLKLVSTTAGKPVYVDAFAVRSR
ncbi:hypothetical protein GCM10025782_26050 [Pedococcus ginsenosidimutans]|uniref:Fibronectin type-III domain-containing protein n=1 Tax=Pedococcus ginsenosidimutans TaxID=490570 RepID=A0ABP8YEK8_9MICO